MTQMDTHNQDSWNQPCNMQQLMRLMRFSDWLVHDMNVSCPTRHNICSLPACQVSIKHLCNYKTQISLKKKNTISRKNRKLRQLTTCDAGSFPCLATMSQFSRTTTGKRNSNCSHAHALMQWYAMLTALSLCQCIELVSEWATDQVCECRREWEQTSQSVSERGKQLPICMSSWQAVISSHTLSFGRNLKKSYRPLPREGHCYDVTVSLLSAW